MSTKIPEHIAIMYDDENDKKLSAKQKLKESYKAITRIENFILWCKGLGVKNISTNSIYINKNELTKVEIQVIKTFISEKIIEIKKFMIKNKVQFKYICPKKNLIPKNILNVLNALEKNTKKCSKIRLFLYINCDSFSDADKERSNSPDLNIPSPNMLINFIQDINTEYIVYNIPNKFTFNSNKTWRNFEKIDLLKIIIKYGKV